MIKLAHILKEGAIQLTSDERAQVERILPDIIKTISGKYIGDNEGVVVDTIKYLYADKTPGKVEIAVGNDLNHKNANGYFTTKDPKNPTDNLIWIQQFQFSPYFKGLSGLDLKANRVLTGNENPGIELLRKVLKHELIHAKDPALNHHYLKEPYDSDDAKVYYKSWTEFQAMTGQFFEAITTGVDRALKLGMSKQKILGVLDNILSFYSGKTDTFIYDTEDFIQGTGKRNIFQSLVNIFVGRSLPPAINTYAEFLAQIKKYNPEGYKEFLKDLYKTIDQAKDKLKSMNEMQPTDEIQRFQELAGIKLEDKNPEQAAEDGLKDFLGDLNSAASSAKPSPKDGQLKEGLLTLSALVAGAPGLLGLLGKGVDLVGKYFSQGTVDSTKVGAALQKAGHKLEHAYIQGIAKLLVKIYPKEYQGQDPFDESTELHDTTHGIYAAILAGAAFASGIEATQAVNLVVKGLEGGAAAFKTAEVAQLAKKIAGA